MNSSHRLSLLPGVHGALTSTGHHTTALLPRHLPLHLPPVGKGRLVEVRVQTTHSPCCSLPPAQRCLGTPGCHAQLPPTGPPASAPGTSGWPFPGPPQTQHPSGSTSLPGPRASGRARRPQITFPILAHTGVLRAAVWRRAGEMADSVLGPTFSALYRQQGTSQLYPACPQSSSGCCWQSKALHGIAGALSPPSIHAKKLHLGPPLPRSPPRLPCPEQQPLWLKTSLNHDYSKR